LKKWSPSLRLTNSRTAPTAAVKTQNAACQPSRRVEQAAAAAQAGAAVVVKAADNQHRYLLAVRIQNNLNNIGINLLFSLSLEISAIKIKKQYTIENKNHYRFLTL
jgi:CBS domain containing-hemolysin-like protein